MYFHINKTLVVLYGRAVPGEGVNVEHPEKAALMCLRALGGTCPAPKNALIPEGTGGCSGAFILVLRTEFCFPPQYICSLLLEKLLLIFDEHSKPRQNNWACISFGLEKAPLS